MGWLDFFIGSCVGSLSGIIFCSWLEKRSKRERDLDIDRSVRKEMEQFRAMERRKGVK